MTHHKESELERDCVKLAEAMGCLTLKCDKIAKGWPDRLILLYNGASFFVEFKLDDGRLSDAQKNIHVKMRARGHTVIVCTSVEYFGAVLREAISRTSESGGWSPS